MYDYLFNNHDLGADAQIVLAGVRPLFCDRYDALVNSAALLAGKRGQRLVEQLRDSVVFEGSLTRQTIEQLFQLLGILTLQNVHNEDLPEAGYFAAIDPSDPVVEEICLLADKLRHAMAAAKIGIKPSIKD